MAGQARHDMFTQRGDVDRRVFRLAVVSHQAYVTRLVFAGDDHGLAHAGAMSQAGFDFTRFDAKATDLHLEVVAPEELQAAVGPVASQVAGTVQALAGDKGIVDKALGGQGGAIQVATGDPGPADMNFTGDADRHQLAQGVEQIAAQVRQRSADGAGAGAFGIFRA